VTLRLRGGLQLSVRPRSIDLDVADEVIRQEAYMPGGWGPQDAQTVVDVGAHIGTFTVLAARRWPRARVLSFEPVPENRALLEANVRLNGCGRVQVNPEAVTGRAGARRMEVSPTNTGGHSLAEGSGGSVEVPAIPFAEVLARAGGAPIDFLKIDAEGAEYEILESLGPEELRLLRYVALEFHGPTRAAAAQGGSRLAALLRGQGMEVRLASSAAGDMLYASRA